MPSWIDVSTTPLSERAGLVNVLDAQRVGLIRKVEDLDDEAARRTPSASPLSLLGLVKHSATWEERWFHVIVGGRESSDGWPTVRSDPPDADLLVDDGDTLGHWLDAYRERGATSNEIVAGLELDATVARTDLIEANVRYVLLHMIEETARHAGHADIIRESLDGTTGI